MNNASVAYSVVIPVYNSEQSLPELVARICAVMQDVIHESFEIVLVDDGSANLCTWPEIERLSQQYPAIRAFRLLRNFGKPNALMCGFDHARGHTIITMDDDLQHAPEDMPKLIALASHDAVIGTYRRTHHGTSVRLGSWIKNIFDTLIIGKPYELRMSPYLLMSSLVAHTMVSVRTPHPFIAALLFFATKDVARVEVTHHERPYGKTSYTHRARLHQFSRLIFNNSAILLKAVGWVGIIMAIISPLTGIFLISRKVMFGTMVHGWTSLMLVILLIGGLILCALGIIGEHLYRMTGSIEARPPYVVRTALGEEPPKSS